ncbi:nucleoside monophosphate kinase [Bacteriovorax stolpii]|uniref:Adenylate kinase n=1 Tax=Bacteriovorax stolpii TaxID=960 RepID=A0A2K9NWS0_BACTC|nr:nucleoside monophosphate kinase [Bacteriovorax stolpii]AUN99969.1 adenylate kinase [Bacteriovorax stolpii]QDK40038.1 nucleoside monophosphate kinase [Bacteriovorax stolpii]TDP54138.1 adenylate kinase [Bacteriovorax stolpii]
MKPHLIILGAPGSGKGTQAAKLVEKGYKHISTGDLLRAEIAKGTELGQKVAGIISRGDLVDDRTVMALLKANCDVDKVSYIFDGFPRNIAQAEMLEAELLQGKKTLAVYFKIDLSILVSRVVNRRTCSKCGEIYNMATKPPRVSDTCDKCGATGSLTQRKDDTEEVVSNRLQIFKDTVDPMLAFYKSKGVLVELDASKQEKDVFSALEKVIG